MEADIPGKTNSYLHCVFGGGGGGGGKKKFFGGGFLFFTKKFLLGITFYFF